MSPENAGWAAGIAQRSPAQRLAWQLKGAPMRKKDLRLSALGGIAEARKLRDKVSSLMVNADADPEDAMIFCVFAEPDLSALVPEVAYLPAATAAQDIHLAAKHPDKLPVGFLVFVFDRAATKAIFGHARPLIVEDPRGLAFNEYALRAYTQRIEDRLRQSGEIPDNRN